MGIRRDRQMTPFEVFRSSERIGEDPDTRILLGGERLSKNGQIIIAMDGKNFERSGPRDFVQEDCLTRLEEIL